MLNRDIWFGAATIVCLLALSANAADPQAQDGTVIIIASPSILPEGTRCRIELQPESTAESVETQTFYEGTIKQITKEKVVLTAAMIEKRSTNTSPVPGIPILNRYFKNTGVGRAPLADKEVPVRVDQIRSITVIEEEQPR